ncbi:hypothetical protein ASZ90_000567 [hydrocarbon metagenome]|uniref:Uncharacterized protein n=1 Tax=hydrocarbon metagenome TaxID=938273 RepID=A0A0W8G8Q7_9ZZZZ
MRRNQLGHVMPPYNGFFFVRSSRGRTRNRRARARKIFTHGTYT